MVEPFLEFFLIKMVFENENCENVKMYVLLNEKQCFRGSGACFGRAKWMKKRLRKRSAFWRAFFMAFGSILGLLLEAKGAPKWRQKLDENWEAFWRAFWRQKGLFSGGPAAIGMAVGFIFW